jgi:hypothetical protein
MASGSFSKNKQSTDRRQHPSVDESVSIDHSVNKSNESNVTNEQTNEQTINSRDLCATDAWPRFLVMESVNQDQPLSKVSPFVIEKAMKGICNAVNVKKLRSGVLLIEVSRPEQATNLLKQTQFANIPVRVTPHRTMNSCKGVIRDRELADLDTSELVDNLKIVGVTDARNIMQNRNGNRTKTAAVILTFARPILPTSIKAGYSIIKVEPYIPNPLRCFTCQGYGHHQATCRRAKICARCGKPDHGTETCTIAPCCANCKGDHPAYATSCPKWREEKEICKAKVTYNVSFPEARRMMTPAVTETNNRILYSAMSRPIVTTASVGTQTDIVNCKCIAQQIPKETGKNLNIVNKELKQASVQTEAIEQLESKDLEEIEDSSQGSNEGWIDVKGRSRARSLDNNRQVSEREKDGEPPGKQFKPSQSPNTSGNKNTYGEGVLRTKGSGSHTGPHTARKPIQPP